VDRCKPLAPGGPASLLPLACPALCSCSFQPRRLRGTGRALHSHPFTTYSTFVGKYTWIQEHNVLEREREAPPRVYGGTRTFALAPVTQRLEISCTTTRYDPLYFKKLRGKSH